MRIRYFLPIVLVLGCNPPKSQADACRRQAAGNRVSRSFSQTSSASADALENMRCDEIEREEHREAREDQQRKEDKAERAEARQEVLSAVKASAPTGCAQRAGHFFTKYREVDGGTCGPRKPESMDVQSQPHSVDAPCSGRIFYSDDNCEVHYEVACPIPGHTGAVASVGNVTWTRDGSEGAGRESFAVDADEGSKCTSTYEVTILHGN